MPDNARGFSLKTLLANFAIDAPDITITDLVLDSREVAIHKGFVAIKGHNLDGRDFVPQAISLGAKVILCECDSSDQHGTMDMREQSLIIQFHHLAEKLSELAVYFYQQPAKQLDVIAVTGTNGKTSTVQLITQLRHLLGDKSASIGTLGAGLYQDDISGVALSETLNTTPDAIQMQRILAEFVSSGSKQVALEASSHALVQGRISDLKTDVAVFTNLSRDHLDYHGTMSEYARAKRLLLAQPGLSTVILNFDDPETQAWLDNLPRSVSAVLFAVNQTEQQMPPEHHYCIATQVRYLPQGCNISLKTSWGENDLTISLLGEFNVANLLGALGAMLALGFDLQKLVSVCHLLRPVAGRMEVFENAQGANLVVDYAHTPDGLEQALKAARIHCQGKLHCIFGCGGDRDQGKRSLMGQIAEQFSDQIIITNDNSRSENPQHIANDILAGCRVPAEATVQLDRKLAIQKAIDNSQENDLILVAGKGHEDFQIIGSQKLPYNEREYVKHLLKGNAQ